ncbi:MAG: LamG-like jellyroll fold domain-containing protein [Gammaproteobacteria bacterium]
MIRIGTIALFAYDGTNVNIYLDGINDGNTTSTIGISNNNQPMSIGVRLSVSPTSLILNGIMSEMRVSHVAHSADWIKASYNNQSTPVSCLTFDPQQTTGAP